MSARVQPLKDEGNNIQVTAAGATAGLISRFVVAPLDVVKIRLQLQTHSLSDPLAWQRNIRGGPIYKGTLPTMRQIVRHEGLTALWKGNVPAELMYLVYAAVQFVTYRFITVMLRRAAGEESPGLGLGGGRGGGRGNDTRSRGRRLLSASAEHFVAGAGAGGFATAWTYPLDLLRTRFAAQGRDRVYRSMRGAVAQIARDEGARGFFRGLTPTMAQIVPYMGIFFATYEALRPPLAALVDLPFGGGDAAAGSMAAAMAKTGTFPLDLVKKRIQVQGPTRAQYVHKNIPEYRKGVVQIMQTIVRQEGFRGLYRGLVVSLIKAAPAAAVTMWTYERSLELYVRLGEYGRERAS